MGLHERDFIHMGEYEQLLVNYPADLSVERAYLSLCLGLQYKLIESKAKMPSDAPISTCTPSLAGQLQGMETVMKCSTASASFTYIADSS